MFDRVSDEHLLDQAGAELDRVESALNRLDDGSYGRCVECAAPIGPDRLASDPLAVLCHRHESADDTVPEEGTVQPVDS